MKTNVCPAHDINLSSINKSYTCHVDEYLAPGKLQAGEDIEPGTLHYGESIPEGVLYAGEDLDEWTLHAM